MNPVDIQEGQPFQGKPDEHKRQEMLMRISSQNFQLFSLSFCRSYLTSCLCLCIFLFLDLGENLYWMFKIFDETRRDEARCSVHSTEKEGVVYVNVLLRVVFAVAKVAVCVVVCVLSCLCLGVRAFSVALCCSELLWVACLFARLLD